MITADDLKPLMPADLLAGFRAAGSGNFTNG
jgi:hypothetical protein